MRLISTLLALALFLSQINSAHALRQQAGLESRDTERQLLSQLDSSAGGLETAAQWDKSGWTSAFSMLLLRYDDAVRTMGGTYLHAEAYYKGRGVPVPDTLALGRVFEKYLLHHEKERLGELSELLNDAVRDLDRIPPDYPSPYDHRVRRSSQDLKEYLQSLLRQMKKLVPGVSTAGLEQGRFEFGRYNISEEVEREVINAGLGLARLSLIREAHDYIRSLDGQPVSKEELDQAVQLNRFIRLAAEWQPVPGKDGFYRVVSRMAPYLMPEKLISEPALLDQIKRELQAIRKAIPKMKRILHFGMGGSAEIGQALVRSGLLRDVPAMIPDTSDPHALSEWLPSAPAELIKFLEGLVVNVMSMGLTSEEPVILFAWLQSLYEQYNVPMKSRLSLLTLTDSSVHQFARTLGFEDRLVDLQPDGRQEAAGRMSGPTATRFPLWLLGLNGRDLKKWAEQAALTADEQLIFTRLGAALVHLAKEGKNKVTLLLPKELEFIAPFMKQGWEESLGVKNKGLGEEDPRFLIKIVIDEPLNEDFYSSAETTDRVILVIRAPNAELSPQQMVFMQRLGQRHHTLLQLKLNKPWAECAAGLLQGNHLAVAEAGYRLNRPFVTQPGVEEYKANAKKMIIGALVQGKFLEPSDVDVKGNVAAAKYFPALIQWALREDPQRGSIFETPVYREIFSGAASADFVGQPIHLAYAGVDPTLIEAMGEKADRGNPAALLKALLGVGRPHVSNAQFRPTQEITSYADTRFTKDGRRLRSLVQEAATDLFRRDWKINVDVGEGPGMNHEYHEAEVNDPGAISIILVPVDHGAPAAGRLSNHYIWAQALATFLALKKAGRIPVLIRYPRNDHAGRQALQEFFRQARPGPATPAGGLEALFPVSRARLLMISETQDVAMPDWLSEAVRRHNDEIIAQQAGLETNTHLLLIQKLFAQRTLNFVRENHYQSKDGLLDFILHADGMIIRTADDMGNAFSLSDTETDFRRWLVMGGGGFGLTDNRFRGDRTPFVADAGLSFETGGPVLTLLLRLRNATLSGEEIRVTTRTGPELTIRLSEQTPAPPAVPAGNDPKKMVVNGSAPLEGAARRIVEDTSLRTFGIPKLGRRTMNRVEYESKVAGLQGMLNYLARKTGDPNLNFIRTENHLIITTTRLPLSARLEAQATQAGLEAEELGSLLRRFSAAGINQRKVRNQTRASLWDRLSAASAEDRVEILVGLARDLDRDRQRWEQTMGRNVSNAFSYNSVLSFCYRSVEQLSRGPALSREVRSGLKDLSQEGSSSERVQMVRRTLFWLSELASKERYHQELSSPLRSLAELLPAGEPAVAAGFLTSAGLEVESVLGGRVLVLAEDAATMEAVYGTLRSALAGTQVRAVASPGGMEREIKLKPDLAIAIGNVALAAAELSAAGIPVVSLAQSTELQTAIDRFVQDREQAILASLLERLSDPLELQASQGSPIRLVFADFDGSLTQDGRSKVSEESKVGVLRYTRPRPDRRHVVLTGRDEQTTRKRFGFDKFWQELGDKANRVQVHGRYGSWLLLSRIQQQISESAGKMRFLTEEVVAEALISAAGSTKSLSGFHVGELSSLDDPEGKLQKENPDMRIKQMGDLRLYTLDASTENSVFAMIVIPKPDSVGDILRYEIARKLRERLPGVIFTYGGTDTINLSYVDKWDLIEHLAREWGIPLQEVAYIGDHAVSGSPDHHALQRVAAEGGKAVLVGPDHVSLSEAVIRSKRLGPAGHDRALEIWSEKTSEAPPRALSPLEIRILVDGIRQQKPEAMETLALLAAHYPEDWAALSRVAEELRVKVPQAGLEAVVTEPTTVDETVPDPAAIRAAAHGQIRSVLRQMHTARSSVGRADLLEMAHLAKGVLLAGDGALRAEVMKALSDRALPPLAMTSVLSLPDSGATEALGILEEPSALSVLERAAQYLEQTDDMWRSSESTRFWMERGFRKEQLDEIKGIVQETTHRLEIVEQVENRFPGAGWGSVRAIPASRYETALKIYLTPEIYRQHRDTLSPRILRGTAIEILELDLANIPVGEGSVIVSLDAIPQLSDVQDHSPLVIVRPSDLSSLTPPALRSIAALADLRKTPIYWVPLSDVMRKDSEGQDKIWLYL